jgi:hypothetical protein
VPDGESEVSMATQPAGFFAALFDVSFSEFITVRFVKSLYVLGIVIVSLLTLALFLAVAAQGESGATLAALILFPMWGILNLILLRCWLEVVVVFFRIGDDVVQLREHVAKIAPQDRG